jgi:hypothetical protein
VSATNPRDIFGGLSVTGLPLRIHASVPPGKPFHGAIRINNGIYFFDAYGLWFHSDAEKAVWLDMAKEQGMISTQDHRGET